MQTNKKSLSNLDKANNTKRGCVHCGKEITLANINKHEKACGKPKVMKECPVCKTMHPKSGVTCSYSCSNTYFRSGKDNGNFRGTQYTTICFSHHKKECIVCGEDKIVTVHHNDHNHHNNDPENLIPLCPTHHQYVHSRYIGEVQPMIDEYVKARCSSV